MLAPKAEINMISEVFRDSYIQMVEVLNEIKLKYSLGADGSPFYSRIITERSLILVSRRSWSKSWIRIRIENFVLIQIPDRQKTNADPQYCRAGYQSNVFSNILAGFIGSY
jgi:hypothetical protein